MTEAQAILAGCFVIAAGIVKVGGGSGWTWFLVAAAIVLL